MTAYYSEFDPKAAAWLRELIKQGHIADGVVDERDLWDVTPDDLRGFTQVHLCAGIGVWSYSLRSAGWPDDRPVWTASFPCQPFSEAGKRSGFADERHLWPAGLHLITECRPGTIFGEQVANGDGLAWLDLVSTDMEATGYAFAAVDLCAAGVGAPHRRQRLFFVADADGKRQSWGPEQDLGPAAQQSASRRDNPGRRGDVRALAHPASERPLSTAHDRARAEESGRTRGGEPQRLRIVGDADGEGREVRTRFGSHDAIEVGETQRQAALEAGFVRGFWSDARWIKCNDPGGPRYRAIEPSTFPLAHGAPARVGRLRGFGNALCAPAAIAWVESYLDARELDDRGLRVSVFD